MSCTSVKPFGRIGNFVNGEAYGTATTLPWGMQINGGMAVHPTFLYEMLVTILIFIVLSIKGNRRKFSGEYTYIYLIIYGFGRMLIEGLRTDSLMLSVFRVSQVLSGILFVVFLGIYVYNIRKCRNVRCTMYDVR